MLDVITPDWPVAATIKAFSTTRNGGCSQRSFTSLNLAHHVGDDFDHVQKNRMLLHQSLELPQEPCWLNQTHGVNIVTATTDHTSFLTADASYTHQPKTICAVLTADCLPVLLCDRKATTVAAIHAGWRGLTAGIIEKTIHL